MRTRGAGGRFQLARIVLFLMMAIGCAGRLAAQSTTFQVLHSFNLSDGSHPSAPVIQGSDGNFYGTTENGGIMDNGTVFQITPAGVLTSLYTFTGGADGADPEGALTQGADGNFYGTTVSGQDDGTVFEITSAGALTTLYTFMGGADGGAPRGGLTLGNDGNFYGTTTGDFGAAGHGTIFQITPTGALTTIYTFTGGADGSQPYAGLIQGIDGNFYGTTETGANGYGTVFKITPAGSLTTLYAFSGTDGANPFAGLIQGSDGNFYGTTASGGNASNGTVFEITSAGVLTTLYSFTGGTDGGAPRGGLIQGSDGDFYGTAYDGGAGYGSGTIFKITPAGVLTTLYIFGLDTMNGSDGANPEAGLTLGSDGSFYGTTVDGGQSVGVVYRLTFPAPAVTSGTASAQVNSAFSYQIVATNSPTGFGASNLPPGLSVDAATGIISGTPTQSGAFTVGLTATNSIGTGSGTLSLTVSPAPVQPPVVSGDTASAQVGAAFSYQIAATNGPTSFAASNLPPGLSIDSATGIISGAPTQSGVFSVGLSATNSGGTGTATLTLTVNPATPVITSASSASGQAGVAFTYQITASNTPTSFGASGLPDGLSVDAGTGVISGTPTASGTFSVNLSATNAGGTGTAVLTITLAPALPVVTLVPTVPQVVVGSGNVGKFILSISAPQAADLIIPYTIKGTAINGVDYNLIKTHKKIKAGKTSKIINILPEGDLEGASKKVVTLVLTPGAAYTIGTTGKVKVKILAAGQ